MLRFLLWRLLGVLAFLFGGAALAWLLSGGPGAALRGDRGALRGPMAVARGAAASLRAVGGGGPDVSLLTALPASIAVLLCAMLVSRWRARRRRAYVRLRVDPYQGDRASAEALTIMFTVLQRQLARRPSRRLLAGQPSLSLEVHYDPGRTAGEGAARAWFAVSCPHGSEFAVEAAMRSAYPNCSLSRAQGARLPAGAMVRLRKARPFVVRAAALDRWVQERHPPVNGLLGVMAACGAAAVVQLALTPAPALLERAAAEEFERRELNGARRRARLAPGRSLLAESELRGGLDVQHSALYFADIRVAADSRVACARIASELRARAAENRLVERRVLACGPRARVRARLQRGEGNPFPALRRGVFAASELAALWQLPGTDYTAVPVTRTTVPVAPAPPGVFRPRSGPGVLRDALGPVSIHPQLRRQNTAAPGAVDQGKTSFLVATIAEDLQRERCAVILLDPKGDAADAALSLVPSARTCTLLDLARPTCGFNPLAVSAPADVIADYVVAALKNLFDAADIRASSDRYLRNAIIAVLAFDARATLWDAARLLSVGEEGYAYRRAVAARVRALPEFKEVAGFFTSELAAQLADAKGPTTAKLDAPVNKLARLLNSPSIKRVLLNESLRVDLDAAIAGVEVLIVKGALGSMGAGNTSVLMQLLVGMLDAALARQQDLVPADERVAVALKIDEAPLVVNRGFADTMALKRSAGLETVACWQADAQWSEPEVRDQLDALFAHRVYFATASVPDARAAAPLAMAEFSDTIRPGVTGLTALGRPDARLRLPRHHAIASLLTPAGRQPAFIAQTVPMRVDREQIAAHAERQHQRGARPLGDLRQPRWSAEPAPRDTSPAVGAAPRGELAASPRAGRRDERAWAPRVSAFAPLPAVAARSFAELVDVDRAQNVRTAAARGAGRVHEPDATDLDVLRLVCSFGHVLSTQIHRRIAPRRDASTTQRRLKRLADAGLLARLQFHRPDGGGVPMCCAITDEGAAALAAGSQARDDGSPGEELHASRAVRPSGGPRAVARVRHELHVSGWVLALERALGERVELRGPAESVLTPPLRRSGGLGPADVLLPDGRVCHDFLYTTGTGERVEPERFDTLRPDATVTVRGIDMLVEREDRFTSSAAAPAPAVAKLERYDHFLSGWSVNTRRYGPRGRTSAIVVFVCRDRARARELARRADGLLCACRAFAGEYPFDWEYPGRERILFASERDVHEGSLAGYSVPRLPPDVRELSDHGDPRERRARTEMCELLVRPNTEAG